MTQPIINSNEDYDILFSAIEKLVWNSGGDGWGYIVSPFYKEFSILYEKRSKRFLRQSTSTAGISFYDGQEGVTFTDKKENTVSDAEIIVIIPYF